jgi:hypothetical protein
MPELDGPMYTSTGRSPGLNGWPFVHIPRERSSREIVRMWTSQDAPVGHVVAGTSAPRTPVAALGRPPTLRRMAFRHPGCRKRGGRHHPQMADSAGQRARSSVGERSLHTREVAGSKPAAPTRNPRFRSDSGGGSSANWCQSPALCQGAEQGRRAAAAWGRATSARRCGMRRAAARSVMEGGHP